MNYSFPAAFFFGLLCLNTAGQAQETVPAHAGAAFPVTGSTVLTAETPAQGRITAAKRQLQVNPNKVQALNDLALACLGRERETADPRYYEQASEALAHGLALEPGNFQLQKTQVALLLGTKQYAKAKEQATLLNHQTPDDVMTYGYLAEADIGLGDYAAAEKSAQWMLNMRPNNVPGLLLGATLRAQYGDPGGALTFLRMAYAETSPVETEELAWILNRMAVVNIDSGLAEAAAPLLARAEQIFPRYPYTTENVARAHGARASASPEPALPGVGSSADHAVSAPAPAMLPVRAMVSLPALPFSPVPLALLTPSPTATERAIRKEQAAVAEHPKNAEVYASLGAAYFQRARETGDVSDYELAEKSLNLSLDIVSTDFPAEAPLESLAEVCMGEHRFSDALMYSQRALALGSGDVSPFAIAGDADADMGNYQKAGLAYARLTPPDMTLAAHAAYARDSRLAYLAFVAGDTPEAVRLMKVSVAEGVEAQLPHENMAWLYYELGEFLTQGGDTLAANAAYLAALEAHPGDYRALAGLAKLRANNGRDAEAITLYQRAIAVVPMPIFVGELGDLYAKSGDPVEANKQYQLVQYIGLLGKINQVLHNRDLALFYADHDTRLPEALALAQKEFEVRHDIYTWDALAWALYKNGKYAEAEQASGKASEYGTRDSLLLFHAGMIAAKLGHSDQARKKLSEALAINPHFHLLYAGVAKQQLTLLDTQLASRSPAANLATADSHAR